MNDLITVVVPVYKVEECLCRCVDSVLGQTYENIEIILVDDGSPDNSPQICDEYASKDNRIKVIHKENGGLSSARKAGFDIAEGEYILFVDSDDYINPDMVEKLVSAIETNDAELAICGYETVFDKRREKHRLPYNESLLSGKEGIIDRYVLSLLGDNRKIFVPGFLCIRLLRKNLIQKEYFASERIYYKEDHIFDLLYSDKINRIAIVNEPLYYYCVKGDSLSNCYRKNKWQMFKELNLFYKDFAEKRNISVEPSVFDSNMITAMFAATDNAVLAGSYSGYIAELKGLLKDTDFESALKNAKNIPLSKSKKIIAILLELKCFHILYYFRKSRLG